MLATIGSTAPFVGLFGTVWGIMNSFIGISNAHTTNLAVVAPGIAEALLATAFGLVAAIPAVMIYNVFARQTAAYRALLGDASAQVMRLVSRDLDRAEMSACRRPRSRRKRHGAFVSITVTDELAEVHDINVTPFIDVMLVLLIIFMVAAPLATVDIAGRSAVLHGAAAAAARQADLSSRSRPTAASRSAMSRCRARRLATRSTGATGGDKDERIFLRGDRAVPYGDVMDADERSARRRLP